MSCVCAMGQTLILINEKPKDIGTTETEMEQQSDFNISSFIVYCIYEA